MASQPIPEEQMYEPDETGAARERLTEAAQAIIMRLDQLAGECVSKRSAIENRWLEDLRQLKGMLDEATETNLRATPEKSRAVINMTRPKTLAWGARLGDLLFPADERNWGISPTPVPTLSRQAKDAADEAARLHQEAADMVEAANRDAAVGTVPEGGQGAALAAAEEKGKLALEAEQREVAAQAVMDEAKRRAEGMTHAIDDQLTECQYPKQSRRSILDGVRLGSGVMKGPLNAKKAARWMQDGASGAYTYKAPDQQTPIFLRVDPWNYFPDYNASDKDSCEYEFERHLPNKSGLRKLARELSFISSAVRELIEEGPGYGSDNNLNHLANIRAITGEGEAVTGRYVVWEYHGPLEKDEVCNLLKASGKSDDEVADFEEDYNALDEVRVIVYFCNGKLLKLEPDWILDSAESLYSVYSFEKSDGSILGGIGIPTMMRDPAKAVNGAWRMLLDNSGLSVGPQIVVDKSRIEPENGSWKMEARKVWLRTGEDLPIDQKVFEVFNIPSNQKDLVSTIEVALKFIDEVTNLPLIAQGEQGAHITQTAGGMSMLMNSANVIFRNAVKNFDDDMTTPNIRRAFDWNMQFNDDESIKGDLQIEARGTSALLVKELQSANLMAIAERWSVHPVLGLALKVYDAQRMAIQSLSINPDDILGTRDDFEKALKSMQEAQAQKINPEEVKLQIAAQDNDTRQLIAGITKEVAEIRRDTEIIKTMDQGDLTREQIQTRLTSEREGRASQERLKAVDVAVENQRRADAESRGTSPDSASGEGVG